MQKGRRSICCFWATKTKSMKIWWSGLSIWTVKRKQVLEHVVWRLWNGERPSLRQQNYYQGWQQGELQLERMEKGWLSLIYLIKTLCCAATDQGTEETAKVSAQMFGGHQRYASGLTQQDYEMDQWQPSKLLLLILVSVRWFGRSIWLQSYTLGAPRKQFRDSYTAGPWGFRWEQGFVVGGAPEHRASSTSSLYQNHTSPQIKTPKSKQPHASGKGSAYSLWNTPLSTSIVTQ